MIDLRQVCRRYTVGGRVVHALCDVDLAIRDGDYVSIMGPSGSGKSTLLNIIGCLDRPTTGTYLLDGQPVDQLDERALSRIRARKIGFVFQVFHLVPRLTAAANVELPMILAGIDPAVRARRVASALEAVNLSDRALHRPDQLSGGERQRVAIARATVMGPAVLLADEPTGNLDRASGSEIVALLEAMNAEGLTLIVVTHDPEVGRRARTQLRMDDGSLVTPATAQVA
ncbi:MAG: ABC transporter ATP-binding protein [Acidobacteriota bacterium]